MRPMTRDEMLAYLRETYPDHDWTAATEVERLRILGDEMARQVEARWSGPGGCDCPVCSAAIAWRHGSKSC